MANETTTANNSFRLPTATNNGSDFAAGLSDLASDVDGMWARGTISSRPAASAPKPLGAYYATDTGQLAFTTGSVWRSLGLVQVLATGSTTAAAGQVIWQNSATAATVTLPAPVLHGQCGVFIASLAASGSNQMTVTTPSGKIVGVGLGSAGATSIALGTPFASLLFQSDGTNWAIIDGLVDTGWVPLTMGLSGTGEAALATHSGYAAPAARVLGDRVLLRGAVDDTLPAAHGSYATGSVIATLPTGFRPSTTVTAHVLQFAGGLGTASSVNIGAQIATTGVLSLYVPVANGDSIVFDGASFRLG